MACQVTRLSALPTTIRNMQHATQSLFPACAISNPPVL
jgi:hypothetical protein